VTATPAPLMHSMRNCLISQDFEAGSKSIDLYTVTLCARYLLGDIIVMRHFCPRHYDGDIFIAIFCSRHFQLEPDQPSGAKCK